MSPTIIVLTLLLPQLPNAAAAYAPSSEYTVRIDDLTRPRARVQAQVRPVDGRLWMDNTQTRHLATGWATFVRDLEAVDSAGRPLVLTRTDTATWRAGNGYSGPVRLQYTVDLSFAQRPWPAGNEQAGKIDDGALFVVSKALFITSDADGPARVTITVPASWQVSTPWQPFGNTSNVFLAKDREDLIRNSLVVGRYRQIVASAGDVTLRVALLGDFAAAGSLVQSVMTNALASYVRLFSPPVPQRDASVASLHPPPVHYLMTFFRADQDDGEAYVTSAAFTTAEPLRTDNMILWGNTLAHELFHFWNGHQIRSSDHDRMQWFSEGATEYYANLTLVRSGLISEDDLIKKMEKHLGMYLYFRWAPPFDGVSLFEAGRRKSYNRPGVYSGGWAASFCMDVQIRSATSGSRSLDDVMRLMYERFGKTHQRYPPEALPAAIRDATGTNGAEFIGRYVTGNETLPVKECLAQAGYTAYTKGYSGEVYLVGTGYPSAEQVSIRNALLGLPRERRTTGR